MPTPTLIQQGTLNRIRGSVVLASFPALNVTSSYMAKTMYSVSFDGDFADLIGTATGAVTSPEPYVMATIEINLLRTQNLALAWLAQAQDTSAIGEVYCHSDTSAFPAIPIDNCIIQSIVPGRFDGVDPTLVVRLKGLFMINNAMWSFV